LSEIEETVVLSNKNINTNNLYIDIETCYIFDQKKEAIVMITIGYNEYNMLQYCNYTGTEEEILKEFKEDIETHFKTYKLVHYGGGESKLFKRLNLTNEVEDLRETFIKSFMNNKNLNNLTGFSIKEIIKSLKTNGLIEENPYDECIIKSGIEVLSIYNYIFENRCINAKELLEEQVIKYNKADVKALSVVDYFLLK
jgi:predicted RecB family nuclease